jgi:hypothetical protein
MNPFNIQSRSEQENLDIVLDSFFTQDVCACGSSEHSSNKHPLCPQNPKNISNKPQTQCQCGSTTHQRRNHKNCPLNRRYLQNSEANSCTSLDDVNDLVNVEINISSQINPIISTEDTQQPTVTDTLRIARKPFQQQFIFGPNIITNLNSPHFLRHVLPKREKKCIYFGALMWIEEKLTNCKKNEYSFGVCCSQGNTTSVVSTSHYRYK